MKGTLHKFVQTEGRMEILLGKSLWSWRSFQTISRFLSFLSLLSFFHSCQHPVLPSWLISITLWLYPLKLLSFSLWYILLSMSEVMALKSFLFFFLQTFFNTSDVILILFFFFFASIPRPWNKVSVKQGFSMFKQQNLVAQSTVCSPNLDSSSQ